MTKTLILSRLRSAAVVPYDGYFLGSVAESIVWRSSAPVLVYRANCVN